MNATNSKKVLEWVKNHQDSLDVRLPPEESCPNGRSGWCHLFGCLVDAYGLRGNPKGYHAIPDSEMDHVFEILNIAYEFAEDPDVYERFPKVEKIRELNEWFENPI